MRLKHRVSLIVSLAVGALGTSLWYRATHGVMDKDTYMWLSAISATMMGFVFTAQQLLMMVLGSEESIVAKIVREENPDYLRELMGIIDLTVLGYFLAAVLGGTVLATDVSSVLLNSLTTFTATTATCLLFILIINIQLIYEDYLEIDLKRNDLRR